MGIALVAIEKGEYIRAIPKVIWLKLKKKLKTFADYCHGWLLPLQVSN
jgi:hypothetical protein